MGEVEDALSLAAGDLAAFSTSRPFRSALVAVSGAADRARIVAALEAVDEPNADVHWLLAELPAERSQRLRHALHWCRLAGSDDVREAPRVYAEVEDTEIAARAAESGFEDAPVVARFRELRAGWLVADAETSAAFRANLERVAALVGAVDGCQLVVRDEDLDPRLRD